LVDVRNVTLPVDVASRGGVYRTARSEDRHRIWINGSVRKLVPAMDTA